MIYFDIYDDVPLARVHAALCVQKRDDFTTLTPILLTPILLPTLQFYCMWYGYGCGVRIGDLHQEHARGSRARGNRKTFTHPSPRNRSRIRKRLTAIKHGLFGARRVVSQRDDCRREYNNIQCAVYRVSESPKLYYFVHRAVGQVYRLGAVPKKKIEKYIQQGRRRPRVYTVFYYLLTHG